MAKSNKIVYMGTGRRKSSIARVRLVEGTGKITINGKDIEEFFDLETLKVIVRQPLTVTNTLAKYDVTVQNIVELNNIRNPNLIYPREKLRITE